MRFVIISSAFALILPLLYSMHLHRDNPAVFTNSGCLAMAVCPIPVHALFCMVHNNRIQVESAIIFPGSDTTDRTLRIGNSSDVLQKLVEQMNKCCANAKPYEREILVRYAEKYSTFYGLCVAWLYMTSLVFDVGTLFLAQPFPSDAEYPFAVDYEPMRTFIFVHQVVVSFQCCAGVSMNVFAALLLLFAGARFEMLVVELRELQGIESLIESVKKYYHLRRYETIVAKDEPMIEPFNGRVENKFLFREKRTILFRRLYNGSGQCCSVLDNLHDDCVYRATGALRPQPYQCKYEVDCCRAIPSYKYVKLFFCQQRQSLTVKVQYMALGAIALLEVFMCAWPADNLLDVSENAVRSLYESSWYNQNVRMQKLVLIGLAPQQPIIISFACVVPVLSLMFYCSYVSNAFSLFTALRLMMYEEEP
ncbi:uncharacterized protein LOC143149688 [Ptiloglossa arizonensis]|uniref:uncharacterized protein LOC143149688 n=1 Tax=Ptiloglossa arizonensis TaxID=3350558 RepID=UPI003FA1735E